MQRRASTFRAAILLVLAGSALILATAPGLSDDGVPVLRPDPDRGLKVARRACASCHALGDGIVRVVPDGVPAFPVIANKPGQTASTIATAVTDPHPPMVDTGLSRAELADIISYLETLRPSGAPPLNRLRPETPDLGLPKAS